MWVVYVCMSLCVQYMMQQKYQFLSGVLTELNCEFSFFLTDCRTDVKMYSLPTTLLEEVRE